MGTYYYGVSSKSRKIKGFDKPVYNVKFLGKAPGFSFNQRSITTWDNMCDAYNRKGSMSGELVAQAIFPDDGEDAPEQFAIVYQYNRGYNVYNDGGDMDFLEVVGYAERVGNRYIRIQKERYDAELKRLDRSIPIEDFIAAESL